MHCCGVDRLDDSCNWRLARLPMILTTMFWVSEKLKLGRQKCLEYNLRPKKIIYLKMLQLYSSARFQWIAWTLFEDEDAEVVEVVKVGSGCDRGVIGGWIVLQSPSMVKRPTRSSLSIIFWWWSSSTSPTTRRCWSSSPAYTYRWWMATWRRSPPTPGPDHQWWIQPLWL